MAALRKPTSSNAENREALARACLLNTALERISARWKMQVLHAVHGGTATYGALKRELPGVSHQVLSTRLRELVDEALLEREEGSYRSTARGVGLLAIMQQICDWEAAG